MIGEYLDGRRMPFFPPVKMLFVLCIFFAVASALVGSGDDRRGGEDKAVGISAKAEAKQAVAEGDDIEDHALFNFYGKQVAVKDIVEEVKAIVEWMEGHKAIELLCLHSFFMLFAWRVFRKSPVRPRTTLPENFFAQVYISGQMMAASIVYILLFGNEQGGFYPLPWWMLLALFVWDFKYLYGFSWKSTIRRTILIHIFSMVLFVFICVVLILLVALASKVF